MRPYLSWGASWGYWSDGINEPLPVADMVTYAQNGHIISARIGFRPQVLDSHWPIPLLIFAGVAEQFSKTTYVGGFGLSGNKGENSSDQLTIAFFGGGLYFPLTPNVNLGAEALQFIAIGDGPYAFAQKNRRAFTIGVAVEF